METWEEQEEEEEEIREKRERGGGGGGVWIRGNKKVVGRRDLQNPDARAGERQWVTGNRWTEAVVICRFEKGWNSGVHCPLNDGVET